MIYTGLTGDVWGGLAFIILVHSGFLLAFHGNVGDIPAGLILLALTIKNPWVAFGLFILATLYEPKLIVALIAWWASGGFWWQSVVYGLIGLAGLGLIWYAKHDWFEWLVEANITIPKRMNKSRKGGYPWMPSFTSVCFLYLGMWVTHAGIINHDIIYWFPPLLYLLFMFAGRVIRPNHLLPIIAWVAASGLDPVYVLALSSVDIIAAGFYISDIWMRFYPGLRDVIKEARSIGEWLKDKPGVLWVNSMYSEIYIWSKKPPVYGMTEQVEIANVATERRQIMRNRFVKNPPEWVVADGRTAGVIFDYGGYHAVAKSLYFVVYRKDKK
jgi:hypothetical protein